MTGSRVLLLLAVAVCGSYAQIAPEEQQSPEDEATQFTKQLCAEKNPQEYFRLNNKDCREVVQCTQVGLEKLVCPPSLSFDLELQTCNWKAQVKNCDKITKDIKILPNFATKEPICDEGKLACGDGTCMLRDLFCDGKVDCTDGSDENLCDINNDPNRAPYCSKAECRLPECYCIDNPSETPGNMPAQTIPQMIMITFDDAVHDQNMDLYNDIFSNRQNPNGCDIKSTFFVSHKYTNYTAVSDLHRRGHEIAIHSISENEDTSYWTKAAVQDWAEEMDGARQILNRFANITDNSVLGLRAPYLRVGGNNQFLMMTEQQFSYDSTIVAPLSDVPLWPYTLFYRMPHECHGHNQHCPTRPFAVWEMVINEMDTREDPINEPPLPGCALIGSCFSNKPTASNFKTFLDINFKRHYESNRAPMGLFFHAAFVKNNAGVLQSFLDWMDNLLATHTDVYFVTMTEVLYWMQDTVPVDQVANFGPWKEKCVSSAAPPCPGTANNCKLSTSELPGETIHLTTCMSCPNKYPWLKDPNGDGNIQPSTPLQ